MNKLVSSSGVLAASVFLTLACSTGATAQADPLPT